MTSPARRLLRLLPRNLHRVYVGLKWGDAREMHFKVARVSFEFCGVPSQFFERSEHFVVFFAPHVHAAPCQPADCSFDANEAPCKTDIRRTCRRPRWFLPLRHVGLAF